MLFTIWVVLLWGGDCEFMVRLVWELWLLCRVLVCLG